MAQFSTGLYFDAQHGEAAGRAYRAQDFQGRWDRVKDEAKPIGLPVDAYNDAEYSGIVYGRGPLFMMALQNQIGNDKMSELLAALLPGLCLADRDAGRISATGGGGFRTGLAGPVRRLGLSAQITAGTVAGQVAGQVLGLVPNLALDQALDQHSKMAGKDHQHADGALLYAGCSPAACGQGAGINSAYANVGAPARRLRASTFSASVDCSPDFTWSRPDAHVHRLPRRAYSAAVLDTHSDSHTVETGAHFAGRGH